MVSPRRNGGNGDQKDNSRIFGWGIGIVVLLLVLVLIYNLVAFKREGSLPKPAAAPPAAVQQQKSQSP